MIKKNDKKAKKFFVWFAAFALIFAIPVCAFIKDYVNADVWFMFNHGRYILSNGLYPESEPFTVHEGLHFTFQKWLSCIIYWLLYKSGGLTALKIFHAVIGCAFVLTMFLLMNYLSPCKRKIRNALLIIVVNILFLPFDELRPQVITYWFLAIELLCLEKYVRENSKKALIFIPILSLLEMQIHSTIWPIILIFMLPYMFDVSNLSFVQKFKIFPKREYSRWLIVLTFFVSIAVAFINPYGAESISYCIKSLFIPELKMTVGEVRAPGLISINTFSAIGFSIWLILVLVKYKRIELRHLFLYGGTLLMAMWSYRQLPFFLIAVLVVFSQRAKNKPADKREYAVLIIPFIIFNIGVCTQVNVFMQNSQQYLTVDVVDYLYNTENARGSNVFCISDPGSYLEFKGFKAYTDTRAEIFSDVLNEKKNIYAERIDYETGEIGYKELFGKYNFDYAVIQNEDLQYDYIIKDNNFKLLYKNKMYSLFKLADT